MSEATTLTLTPDEVEEITGYKRAADQLKALESRGFYRAFLRAGRVVLERAHYEAVRREQRGGAAMTPTPEQVEACPGFAEWHGGRYAGLQLAIAQAAWNAACAWQGERDAQICDRLTTALDIGGNEYRREAFASQCARAIRSDCAETWKAG